MISTSQSKLIRSLRQKKYRDQSRLYLAEGEKMVIELLAGKGGLAHQIQELFASRDWIDRNEDLLDQFKNRVNEASAAELKKVSNLVTPQQVLALVNQPKRIFQLDPLLNNPVLAFESIRDPGNLGTIIRTADWFGIDHMVCSPDSADLYNPKVVQATMGAIARVEVYYTNIEQLLAESEMKKKIVYGTFLEGENIYESKMEQNPLVLFGNESRGLSDRFDPFIHRRIAIPSYSRIGKGSESLNIASSVAVFCSELKRLG